MQIETGTARGAQMSATHGWIIGHFVSGIGKTSDFEVKLWEYDAVDIEYPLKIFHGTECIVVYKGILRLVLEQDGRQKDILLSGGDTQDYIILGPRIVKRVIPVSVPVFGFTVRWPSEPERNQVLPDDEISEVKIAKCDDKDAVVINPYAHEPKSIDFFPPGGKTLRNVPRMERL